MAGDPVAYAAHLRKQPLAHARERVQIQFYKGDPNVENPQTSALIRAGICSSSRRITGTILRSRITGPGEKSTSEIVVIQNWEAEAKRNRGKFN